MWLRVLKEGLSSEHEQMDTICINLAVTASVTVDWEKHAIYFDKDGVFFSSLSRTEECMRAVDGIFKAMSAMYNSPVLTSKQPARY